MCIVLGTILATIVVFHFYEQVGSGIARISMPALGEGTIEVAVAQHAPVIELCVYDFGCEDGDRIEVTLNGNAVFRGELYAENQCFTDLDVTPGRNMVALKALNGSGGKGGCPNDINTGALTVAGINYESWQEYSWAQSTGQSAEAYIFARPSRSRMQHK